MSKRAALVRVDSAERLVEALALSARAPIGVAIDAETAVGIARTRPEVVVAARSAFAGGRLVALVTTAHGADAALLGDDELADELRLDEETLQLVFGVALDRRGFAGADADVAALERAGVDFVVGDVEAPLRIGERLLVIPTVARLFMPNARSNLGEASSPDSSGWMMASRPSPSGSRCSASQSKKAITGGSTSRRKMLSLVAS